MSREKTGILHSVYEDKGIAMQDTRFLADFPSTNDSIRR